MDEPTLILQREGALARLVLNRPGQGNAIDAALARALREAAAACDDDGTIRCVLIEARGRLFCAGGDVRAFDAAGPALPALVGAITDDLNAALARLARMDKPLVAALQGPAAGAGLGLALCADVVLAARGVHLSAGYTALGLSPDAGVSWWLPRLAGMRRAQELLLTQRRVPADEALLLGLVTQVVDDAALAEEALGVARRLAAGPTQAYGRTRALLRSSLETTLETQLAAEARSIATLAQGADARDGVAAFAQRRAPRFGQAQACPRS